MKRSAFLILLMLPLLAFAGAYEDMEEALIRNNSPAAIELIQRGMDVKTVDRSGNTLLVQSIRGDLPELFRRAAEGLVGVIQVGFVGSATFSILPKSSHKVPDSGIHRWYTKEQVMAVRNALVAHEAIKGKREITSVRCCGERSVKILSAAKYWQPPDQLRHIRTLKLKRIF